jgi:toxin ParE1/3/4
MKARFTLPALADLESIIDHVAERSPSAADRIADRVAAIAELICNQPEVGRATDDPTIRRFNLAPYRYVVFYEVSADEIVIMAVRHGARDPATMPGFDGGRD